MLLTTVESDFPTGTNSPVGSQVDSQHGPLVPPLTLIATIPKTPTRVKLNVPCRRHAGSRGSDDACGLARSLRPRRFLVGRLSAVQGRQTHPLGD